MRDYAKVPSQFWISKKGHRIRKLGIEARLLSIYLMTNSHATMIGVYYLPVNFIAHETGLSLKGAFKGLQSLISIGFCSYDDATEYVWVHDTAFDQVSFQLTQNDNRIKAVNEAYHHLPELPFLQGFYEQYHNAFFLNTERKNRYSNEAPSKPLLSQEQYQEQEQEQKQKKKKDMSSKQNTIPINFLSSKKDPLKTSIKLEAIKILNFLNEKTGRAYRPVNTNLKLIEARLQSGATECDCFQVIAKKTREWKGNANMVEYLRPATLFNATKFEQYMGELVLPTDEGDQTHEAI